VSPFRGAAGVARILPVLLALAAVGCSSAIPPVRVYGEPRELSDLLGRWAGEYVGDRVDTRRGSVFFELEEGSDHAHGDVLMTPEGQDRPFTRHPVGAPAGDPDMRRPVEFLSIRFVALDDGTVTGALDPYWDPDRRDQATTTFRGRLDGDTMRGTYVTRFLKGGENVTGTWTAKRSR
jgi:hypothetical protein